MMVYLFVIQFSEVESVSFGKW